MITTATPLLQTGLGFNPFKAAAGLVKQSITVPTKLALKVAENKNVQRAAIQAGETYAQQNYAAQVATANRARCVLNPQNCPSGPGPGGAPQMGPMPPPGMDTSDGGGMPGGGPAGGGMPGGGPAGAGNSHMMLYGLIGAGIIVALLVMKK